MLNRASRFLFFILLNIVIIIIPFFSLNAISQTNKGLTIVPAVNQVDAEKNRVYNLSIRLENDSTADQNISMYVQTFKASGEEGAPTLTDFSADDETKDWISFPNPSFSVKGGEKYEVPYTLTVPENAKSKSQYFAIIFEISPSLKNDIPTSKVNIKQRLAGLLFVNVDGNFNQLLKVNQEINANFSSFKLGETYIVDSFFDPLLIKYKIQNEGQKFLSPIGNLFITNGGEVIEQLDLNPENKIVINQTTRTFQYYYPEKLSNWWLFSNTNKPSEDIKFIQKENNLPIFANLEVNIKANYLNDKNQIQTLENKQKIIIFPYKIILTIIIISVILILSFIVVKKIKTNINIKAYGKKSPKEQKN